MDAPQARGNDRAKARVLIADPDKLFAEALCFVLAARGLEAGVCSNEHDALAAVDSWSPELVLVSLYLPGAGGIEAGRRLLENRSKPAVLILADSNEPAALRDAQRSGLGYVSKNTPMAQFMTAVNVALEGNVVVSLASSPTVIVSQEQSDTDLLVQQLTPRERDVLALLVGGASTKRIADSLSVTSNTVRAHLQNILTKLQVHSRLEAAAFAVRSGVVKRRSARHLRLV